jgi:hypothetical protein
MLLIFENGLKLKSSARACAWRHRRRGHRSPPWPAHLVIRSESTPSVRLGQRHGLQNTTLTSCHYKTIYQRVIYLYFYESIFKDKYIRIVFASANSTI